MDRPTVMLAGATGDQGRRTAVALLDRGAEVTALVRSESSPAARDALRAAGARVTQVDLDDVEDIAAACTGAVSLVSTLSGLREVIVERQTVLMKAAEQAGVRRFIPSDYAADFTRIAPGGNRNFDLHREFMQRADRSPLAVTSILNGAFMDMLGDQIPLIQPRLRRVLHWGDRHQQLDFTTRDDVARYTAAAALDPEAPRILRISGAAVSVVDIAAAMSEVTGQAYRTQRVGGLRGLDLLIRATRTVAPARDEVFPAWQGMQYLRDQFAGLVQLTPLDNDRYPDVRWTSLGSFLRARFADGAAGQAAVA